MDDAFPGMHNRNTLRLFEEWMVAQGSGGGGESCASASAARAVMSSFDALLAQIQAITQDPVEVVASRTIIVVGKMEQHRQAPGRYWGTPPQNYLKVFNCPLSDQAILIEFGSSIGCSQKLMKPSY